MTVSLNIESDSELRNYIKDCIKGQVLSIVREELIDMIKFELERKIKGFTGPNFNSLVSNCTKTAIREILEKEHGVARWNTEYLKPFVNSAVADAVAGTDWKKLVDTLAKEKVRALIN